MSMRRAIGLNLFCLVIVGSILARSHQYRVMIIAGLFLFVIYLVISLQSFLAWKRERKEDDHQQESAYDER